METTATFTVSSQGTESGLPYNGTFVVKTILTRRERFMADQVRRDLIGPAPEGSVIPPKLQAEAFMLGQLSVRIVKAPKFWVDSDSGVELQDGNIITEVFGLATREEEKRLAELQSAADKAVEELSEDLSEDTE